MQTIPHHWLQTGYRHKAPTTGKQETLYPWDPRGEFAALQKEALYTECPHGLGTI